MTLIHFEGITEVIIIFDLQFSHFSYKSANFALSVPTRDDESGFSFVLYLATFHILATKNGVYDLCLIKYTFSGWFTTCYRKYYDIFCDKSLINAV